MKKQINLTEVEKIIGYKFSRPKLLIKALTHSSYSNEHNVESNERLEFLGDAVIEFIITERLFLEFSEKEGDLSKIRSMIVSEKPLAEAVDKLGLEKYLLKGVGESKNQISSKAVKCDMFEAIVGAIFLDGGMENAKKFFNFAVGEKLDNIKVNGFVDDPKTKLQEMLKQAKIVYQTSKSGADHQPTYKTNVYINDVKMGSGTGTNKRSSEEMAASKAINNLKQV